MNTKFILSSILGFGILTLSTAPAQALTINRNFSPAGTPLPLLGLVAGSPSTNVAGGGDLVDIFNTAADYWEAAILDDHTVNINFGWLDFSFVGSPDSIALGGSLQGLFPPTDSLVVFNNRDSVDWFFDPTPAQNEEYQQYTETVENLGGGELNVGRVYTDPTGDAVNRVDMLSIAVHEIGHALGFFYSSTPGIVNNPEFTFPTITVTAPRPFAGTLIPTTTNLGGHIDGTQLPLVQMNDLPSTDSRVLLSGVDILAIAETNNFSQLNLDPRLPVPESNSILGLLGLGLLGVWAGFKKPYFRK